MAGAAHRGERRLHDRCYCVAGVFARFAEDPRTSSSVNPSPPRNQRRRIIAEDLRTPASSSANQPLRPIAKKQRTAEDMRGSEAVKLAVGFLEDEFK